MISSFIETQFNMFTEEPMERRDSLKILAATTGAFLVGKNSVALAAEKKAHDHSKKHSSHHAATESEKKSEKKSGKPSFSELNHAGAHCNHVAQMCVGHCFTLIAQGQKNMVECAQAALEVAAMSDALSRLAGLGSDLCAVQAKACIVACEKCMKACEPHIHHHAQCKECFEACKDCMETCKAFAA